MDLLFNASLEIGVGLIVKRGHAQNDGIALNTGAGGGQLDRIAHDCYVKGLILPLADDCDNDFRADGPAQQINSLGQREAHQVFPIHMRDEISGLDARLCGGGVIHRGNHFDKAVLLGDFHPQTAKFAARLHAHVFGILWGQIARMRIKR